MSNGPCFLDASTADLASHTKAGGRRARHRVRLADAHHSSSRNAKAARSGGTRSGYALRMDEHFGHGRLYRLLRLPALSELHGEERAATLRAAKERAPVATAAYDAMTGPAIRFRPQPATHQRANAREARSFTANGLPLRGQSLFAYTQRPAADRRRVRAVASAIGPAA